MKGSLDGNDWRLHTGWRHHVATALLMSGMMLVLSVVAWTVAGGLGLACALAAGGYALMVLRRAPWSRLLRAQRAVPVMANGQAGVTRMLQHLAHRCGLKKVPQLYVSPDSVPNAYAVGTSTRSPSVVLTRGLLQAMPTRELVAILAHEVAHLRNADTTIMTAAGVARWLTRGLAALGLVVLIVGVPEAMHEPPTMRWWLAALLVVGPTSALLLQLALQRTREFQADLTAIRLTQDPGGLANALIRVEHIHSRSQRPWGKALPKWLRSHPTPLERIQRLAVLEAGIHRP